MMKNTIIYVIAVIAATGGLLFGFDTGVISGAIPFFQKDFGLDNSMVELVTSAGLVGAILGALFCGKITDILGRKVVILASAVIFTIGALWSGFAPSIEQLIIARLFLGIAIGVSSFAVPLYIAEISPANKRGSLVSMFQLMITIGVVPALILLIGMAFMPESPRWLISRGRDEEGKSVLARIEGNEAMEDSYKTIKNELIKSEKDKSGIKELMKPWLRNAVIIGVGIMFFQQFVGINTVIYYSPKIFLMAGFDGAVSAIWAAVGVGVVNLLFTIVSVYFVDRLGRRKLYFTGLTGIFISLLLLGICFTHFSYLGEMGKWLSIILVFVYVAFYAISIGPLGWLIISEVFPQKVRGLGSSLGSLSVWVFNTVVTFTFFKIVKAFTVEGTEIYLDGENLGNPAGAFWFYAIVALAAIIWGYFYVPETKGVTLEKIEEYWRKGGKPRHLR